MIEKIILLLGLIHVVTSSLNLTRTAKYEHITCSGELNCTKFSSTKLAPSVCECTGGTFYYRSNSQNQLECLRGSGLFANCSYQFTSNQLFPQTISLSKDQANGQAGSASDFSSSVMTAGVNCHSLSIAGMEVLDNNMEWKQVQKESHIVKSTQGYYYIRWNNPDSVNTDEYVGNIIKFNLECFADYGIKISQCLLGKIEGTKPFNGDALSDICGKAETTQTIATFTLTKSTNAPTQFSSSTKTTKHGQSATDTSNQSITTRRKLEQSTIATKTTKRGNSTLPVTRLSSKSSLLPIIITAICFSVLLVVCIILGCCIWRRRKGALISKEKGVLTKHSEEQEELYALPSDPKGAANSSYIVLKSDIDNPSYLMGLKNDSEDKHEYAYTAPNVKGDTHDVKNKIKKELGNTYYNVKSTSKNSDDTLFNNNKIMFDIESKKPDGNPNDLNNDVGNPSYLMGLKSNSEEKHEYAYTVPNVNSNTQDNRNKIKDKSGSMYYNVKPSSKNSSEGPFNDHKKVDPKSKNANDNPSGLKSDVDNPSYLMGLKSSSEETFDYANAAPNVNSNTHDNNNKITDKPEGMPHNTTNSSYETPFNDKRVMIDPKSKYVNRNSCNHANETKEISENTYFDATAPTKNCYEAPFSKNKVVVDPESKNLHNGTYDHNSSNSIIHKSINNHGNVISSHKNCYETPFNDDKAMLDHKLKNAENDANDPYTKTDESRGNKTKNNSLDSF